MSQIEDRVSKLEQDVAALHRAIINEVVDMLDRESDTIVWHGGARIVKSMVTAPLRWVTGWFHRAPAPAAAPEAAPEAAPATAPAAA